MENQLQNLIKKVKEYYPENYNDELLINQSYNVKLHELKKHNIYKVQYFLDLFNDNFLSYSIYNDSDFDEFSSLEFIILLHKDKPIMDNDIELIESLNYVKYELNISISIFEKVYYMYINEIMYDPTTCMWNVYKDINPKTDIHEEIKSRAKTIMDNQGYTLLSKSEISKEIKDISTPLVQKGNVKLFHAAFNDIKTPFQDEFCI